MPTGVYARLFLDSAPAPTIIPILTGLFVPAFARCSILIRRALARGRKYLSKVWTSEQDSFRLNPIQQMPGSNTSG